jgi:hypothetical protein
MEYRFNEEEHIHELLVDGKWKPLIGTSSMASVLSKPLTYWAAGLAVEKFGWTNKGNVKAGWTPKEVRLQTAVTRRKEISVITDEDYLKLLDDAYTAHATKLKTSAKDGTDLHELMEKYVKLCMKKNNGKPANVKTENPKLQIFMDWSLRNVKRFLWSESNCYSKELWLGGISDCGYEDFEGKYAILDFKSSKEAYTSQFWQCVGYAMQMEENGLFKPDGTLIMKLDKPIDYVSVIPFGMENPEVQNYYDMEKGKEAVRAMLTLYKMLN